MKASRTLMSFLYCRQIFRCFTNLKKKNLIRMFGISNYTINKLNAEKSVTRDALVKICEALHCGLEGIMDVVEN